MFGRLIMPVSMIISAATIALSLILRGRAGFLQIAVPVLLVTAAASILLQLREFKRERVRAEEIGLAHPGATTLLAPTTKWTGSRLLQRWSVLVAVVDRSGLSFRDREDGEVLRILPNDVTALDLVATSGRNGSQNVQVTTRDSTVVFTTGWKEGEVPERFADLQKALGRTPPA